MTQRDWLTAGVVALFVALITATLTAPPQCWAMDKTRVTVPALPSGELLIPEMHARVTASVVPESGQNVDVSLTLTSTAHERLGAVPITITMSSSNQRMSMSRNPQPSVALAPPEQINVVLPVGNDGQGSIVVPLPLTWTTLNTTPGAGAAPQTANTNNQLVLLNPPSKISYQLVISSPLGEKSLPWQISPISTGAKEIFNVAPAQRMTAMPAFNTALAPGWSSVLITPNLNLNMPAQGFASLPQQNGAGTQMNEIAARFLVR